MPQIYWTELCEYQLRSESRATLEMYLGHDRVSKVSCSLVAACEIEPGPSHSQEHGVLAAARQGSPRVVLRLCGGSKNEQTQLYL